MVQFGYGLRDVSGMKCSYRGRYIGFDLEGSTTEMDFYNLLRLYHSWCSKSLKQFSSEGFLQDFIQDMV